MYTKRSHWLILVTKAYALHPDTRHRKFLEKTLGRTV